MKKFLLTLPFLALAPLATAQNATTTPVGAVTVRLDANKKAAISIPLEQAPVLSGVVTAVSPNTITSNSSSFGSYANSHFCKITSGNAVGRYFLITANTATTLTLRTGNLNYALPVDSSSSNTANVAVGDRFEIAPMFTLGGIFGSNSTTCVLRTAPAPNNADQVTIYSDGTQLSFFNNGTSWRNALNGGDTASYNNVGIMPTAGVWVLRRSTGTSTDLTFVGSVPVIAPKVQVPGGVKTAVSLPAPVGTSLANLGFANVSGWTKADRPNNADQITVYRPDNTQTTYFLNNSNVWRNAINGGDTANYANTLIPAGSGIWVTRRGSSSGPATLAQTVLNYNPANQ